MNLLFAPEALNLAEVTRMLEIAKACRDAFRPIFLSYDGQGRHHALIEREGFTVERLAPQMDAASEQRFWDVDRGAKLGGIFSDEDLETRVRSELELYERVSPVAIVTGFCLSTSISARAAGIPLVWISQTTWLPEYARAFAEWPDAFDARWTRLLPFRSQLARRLPAIVMRGLVRPFNRVGARFGVRPFAGHDLLEGDLTLFAEPEGFSPLGVPSRLQGSFIGALPARLDTPLPAAVRALRRERPIVYFAMGSSGLEDIVVRLLEGFAGENFDVIAPVAALVRSRGVTVPSNVLVTDWLPALEANALADVALIHGGIGTVMTACSAGTPVVGIGNGNPEQEYNLDCVVRLGFARRYGKNRFTPRVVNDALRALTLDGAHRTKAKQFQRVVNALDGPREAARVLAARFSRPEPRVSGSASSFQPVAPAYPSPR